MANIQELVIDKKQAGDWLLKNFSNRTLSKRHVDFLQKQMNSGQWAYSADPIRFAGDFTRLLDGQHRLTAFVQSTMQEMRVLLITGLDESVFDNMDTGKTRNAGDLLSSVGYASGQKLAATIKMIHIIKSGLVGVRNAQGGGGSMKGGTASMTNHDVSLFLHANPALIDMNRQSDRWYKSFSALTTSEYGCFYFVFSEKDPDMAFEFLNTFAKGANLSELSPVFVLRKKLEQNKNSSTKMTGKMKQSLIIQAWNAYRQGKEVKRLQFTPGDALPNIL